jgi:hypothetical protein
MCADEVAAPVSGSEPLELVSSPWLAERGGALSATPGTALSGSIGVNADVPALSVPAYSSLPGAEDTLYLDFNGDFETTWGTYANVDTPPYDIDGNLATFSAAELNNIRSIWAQVAEDYAPFDLNVTTIAPPSFANGVGLHLVIGGNGSWTGGTYGGVTYLSSYSNASPNVDFVFPTNLANGVAKYVGEAASHESGHAFGLQHQSVYNADKVKSSEYNPGSAETAPIMGNSYLATRGLWWNGTSTSATTSQDDMAVIASSFNTFGYRPDDYGDTLAAATPLPTNGGTTFNVAGIIGSTQDVDVFSFNASAGQATFTISGPGDYGNLDAVLELRNAAGVTVATAAPADSLGATLTTTLVSGNYYLIAKSQGAYGDVGQYTINGTLPGQVPPSTIIIDDSDARFTTTGNWTAYPAQGFQNNMHYAGLGGGASVATWSADVTPGQYAVDVTWYADPNRATNAPYTVLDGVASRGTTRVNQELSPVGTLEQGATWQTLGTYTISGNRLIVQLTNSANGYVIADAIRIRALTTTTPPSPIIDDSDVRFTTTGNWTAYPDQGFQNNMHYAGLGGGASVANWSADVTPGQYAVDVTWYADPNRATNAPYTVLDGVASRGTTRVNQQLSPVGTLEQGATWQTLGTYTISGGRLIVQLTNNANGYVIADAIRIRTLTTTTPPSPIIDDSDVRFTTAGNWTSYPDQGFQNNMHYAGLGGGASVATWSADVTPGQYAVDVTWYADPNRATNAPYTVLDGVASRGTTRVNQQLSPVGTLEQGATWQTLGTYTISGNRLIVQLTNNANGYVIADAIRVRQVATSAAASIILANAREVPVFTDTPQFGERVPAPSTLKSESINSRQDPRLSAHFWDSLLSDLAIANMVNGWNSSDPQTVKTGGRWLGSHIPHFMTDRS